MSALPNEWEGFCPPRKKHGRVFVRVAKTMGGFLSAFQKTAGGLLSGRGFVRDSRQPWQVENVVIYSLQYKSQVHFFLKTRQIHIKELLKEPSVGMNISVKFGYN